MTSDTASLDLQCPIRKVGFTSDFLRFSIEPHGYSSFQPRNLVWLVELLTGSGAWRGLGVETSVVLPPQEVSTLERAMGSAPVLTDYRRDAEQAWASRYDTEEPDLLPSVFEQLLEYDLIIGFELSPTIKRFLHRHGRPYLSLCIHPLRFLRDLCFGVSTNSLTLASHLQGRQIAPHETDRQVRRFRALFRRQQLAVCAMPAGLPVLVGQTERDSVLIRDGEFARWQDYTDALAKWLAPFDELIFLEHPYRRSSSDIIEYLRGDLGKTVIATSANSYAVAFAGADIPLVLTLASSLGVEAEAMGLQTQFLLADPRCKFSTAGVDLPLDGAFGHIVLSDCFWATVFAGDELPSKADAAKQVDDFWLGEHYVRNSLDAWSYRPLQFGLSGMTSRKTLVPAANLTQRRRDRLLSDLAASPVTLDLETSTRRALEQGVQLSLMDAPISLSEDRQLDFDDPAASGYLVAGFHRPETTSVWTSALRSRLSIPVAPQVVNCGGWLTISLRMRVFEPLLHKAPVLRISSDDREIGFVFFRVSHAAQQAVSFVVCPSSSDCQIDFQFSDLATPSADGVSNDHRWLGFALSDLSIACGVPEDPPSVAEASILWGIGIEPVTSRHNGDARGN